MSENNRLSIKEKLEKFVTDYDFPLLRILLYSRWMIWALLLMILIVASLPLSLAKIWKTTPDGFEPVVKISILDVAQAWSFRRAALKEFAEDKFEDSVHAWHSAIANDPGNVEYMREYFRFLIDHDQNRLKSSQATQNGMWFLRITQTNKTDFALLTDVFDHYHLYTYNHFFLHPRRDELDIDLEKKYLKALFHTETIDVFANRIRKLDDEMVSKDPELELYKTAYLAIWGPDESANRYKELFRTKLDDPEFRDLAHILNLSVSQAAYEAEPFKASLDYLMSKKSDKLMHHILYWNMLVELGRKSETVELLKQYNNDPASAVELSYFGQLAIGLGENDLALEYFAKHASRFVYYEPMWLIYSNELIRTKQWSELRKSALMIRKSSNLTESLKGLSEYFEARAAIGEGRFKAADGFVAKVVQHEYTTPQTGLHIGKGIGDHGYGPQALAILGPLESAYRDNQSYWQTVFSISQKEKLRESLLKSAENLYRLQPNNAVYLNNYAAILLSERQKPAVAISLTRELMNRDKDINIGSIINHALALVLNQRFDEAVEYMQKVPMDQLPAEMKPGFYLAWFEITFRSNQFDLARDYIDKIDTESLLPGDKVWFEEAVNTLSAEQLN